METKNSKNNKKEKEFSMPLHPLINFEIQKYYQNQIRFNGVCSRDNLPKIKDRVYVINLEINLVINLVINLGTHWIALQVLNNDVTHFHSFRTEHIPKEIKAFVGNKNIKTNIFRIQAYDSIVCGYFCIGFIDFMLAGKTLTDLTNRF